MPDSIHAALKALQHGQMIIVTDDDDRENEGDLVCAASLCTPEMMAFIIRHTSGIVCAPLPSEEARRLRLDLMVAENDAPLATAFTVSVDVRHGLTTGISAEQRCNTVRGLADGAMGAQDFVRPGHVFPLIAREGGVLMRSGHTEAAVDLCRLAGLPPVGVICELANDDGTVMTGSDITAFATRHNLLCISVSALIRWRQAREKLVERVASFMLPTRIGEVQAHAYASPLDQVQHLVLVYGEIGEGTNMLTRFHRADTARDVFGGGKMLEAALRCFQREGRGVLVYLREGSVGVPRKSWTTPAHETSDSSEAKRRAEWREIGLGAQILRDLGISSIRNLTTAPRSYIGLGGFGIALTGEERLEAE
jgi:3,4-dihydroxy 2-butanone 4-phosphate synthase / GTP cyclohydrolase II